MSLAPGITVNGIKITPDQINAEMQYHPAPSMFDAKYEAMRALVIRELLIQKAAQRGLCDEGQAVTEADDIIDRLLEQDIKLPDPDEETCKRYYENNRAKFITSPLFEVSHILYLAPPDDQAARQAALEKAKTALNTLRDHPQLFETFAKDHSACSSGRSGGHLGQISRGQTVPAFETALMAMKAGELCAAPVESEVGYHIIRVHQRVEGNTLPFESVQQWIADHLTQQSWQRAISQYIQILAGEAKISGFILKSADSPLVQ